MVLIMLFVHLANNHPDIFLSWHNPKAVLQVFYQKYHDFFDCKSYQDNSYKILNKCNLSIYSLYVSIHHQVCPPHQLKMNNLLRLQDYHRKTFQYVLLHYLHILFSTHHLFHYNQCPKKVILLFLLLHEV